MKTTLPAKGYFKVGNVEYYCNKNGVVTKTKKRADGKGRYEKRTAGFTCRSFCFSGSSVDKPARFVRNQAKDKTILIFSKDYGKIKTRKKWGNEETKWRRQ